MSKSCKLSIYTPSSVVAKDVVATSILVPTQRGQINVLEDHTHLLTALGTGHLTVLSDKRQEFFISEGLCKILHDKVVIMAKSAEPKSKIDLDRAKNSLLEAQKALSEDSLTESQYNDFYAQKRRAEARISLIAHH